MMSVMGMRLEVVCDSCQIPACYGKDSQGRGMMSAREHAARAGWLYIDGTDLCPQCLKSGVAAPTWA